jgi:predicted nucleic acid-binding protein
VKIIVDSNIAFSSLLSADNTFRNELIFNEEAEFYTCRFLIVEIFKHKEKIVKVSKLQEEELLEVFHEILKNIEFYNEVHISEENWKEAYELCKDVDLKDMPFVALTLEIDGRLWSGDEMLKDNLRNKGFNRFFTP